MASAQGRLERLCDLDLTEPSPPLRPLTTLLVDQSSKVDLAELISGQAPQSIGGWTEFVGLHPFGFRRSDQEAHAFGASFNNSPVEAEQPRSSRKVWPEPRGRSRGLPVKRLQDGHGANGKPLGKRRQYFPGTTPEWWRRGSVDGAFPDPDAEGMTALEVVRLAEVRRLTRSGEALRIRLATGRSLQEIGSAVGVTPVTVWRWERGQRSPRGPAAIAYCELLRQLAGLADEPLQATA